MKLVCDLHIHSIVSDGSLHPADIVNVSKSRSVKVISITDHNTFLGSIVASKYMDKTQLLIYGAEFMTYVGEVLLLCPNKIEGVNTLRDLNTLIDLGRSNNCLVVPPHPYDILRLGIGNLVKLDVWDAVEVFNASSDPISNLITYLAVMKSNKPLLANSDAHVAELIGASYSIVDVDDFTVDDVLESIRGFRVQPVMKYSITGSISRLSWGLKKFIHHRCKTGYCRL